MAIASWCCTGRRCGGSRRAERSILASVGGQAALVELIGTALRHGCWTFRDPPPGSLAWPGLLSHNALHYSGPSPVRCDDSIERLGDDPRMSDARAGVGRRPGVSDRTPHSPRCREQSWRERGGGRCTRAVGGDDCTPVAASGASCAAPRAAADRRGVSSDEELRPALAPHHATPYAHPPRRSQPPPRRSLAPERNE